MLPIILIWEEKDKVYTRPVMFDEFSKPITFKGRKPQKAIVPESFPKAAYKNLQSIMSYKNLIVKAKGK